MKVVISGYYGFGNVGDEAVLASLLDGLRKRAPKLDIVVLSSHPGITEEFNAVHSVNRSHWMEVISEIKSADIVLSGGGTLFQDVTSSLSFLYYAGIIFLSKLLGKKVVVFAQGFGPLKGKINRWIAALLLRRVDLITLRDNLSLKEINKLKADKNKVFVTADPTGSMRLSAEELLEGRKILSLEGVPPGKPLLGVSVRKLLKSSPPIPLSIENGEGVERNKFWFGKNGGEVCYSSSLAKGIDAICEKFGYHPVFTIFQNPEDLAQTSKVIKLMRMKPGIVFRLCHPKEMLAVVSQFDVLIGMRLHALIFSLLACVPMLGISYDPKVMAFMEMIGQPCVEAGKELEIIKHLEEIVARRQEIRKTLEIKRKIFYDKADMNFDLFFKAFSGQAREIIS